MPASFDEAARELTVEAAKKAELASITLLEEPQAAFYCWIVSHQDRWQREVRAGELILVCDIGGGTTDFSMITVVETPTGPGFRRVAVGDHLMLGGDNIDLALAHHVEKKLGGVRLDTEQWSALRFACRTAKEKLLVQQQPLLERWPVTIAGRGSRIIGGSIQSELTRDEVQAVALDGFFPRVARGEEPGRGARIGLQEFGLPFVSDPAVPKHMSAFLRRHRAEAIGQGGHQPEDRPARPDAILFNGGALTPESVRSRIVEVIASWFPDDPGPPYAPRVLTNVSLDLAVAQGAAYYGVVRRGGGIRIGGGTARSFYVGLETQQAAKPWMCVVPRDAQEGDEIAIDGHDFDLLMGQPVVFPLASSSVRPDDKPGRLVARRSRLDSRAAPAPEPDAGGPQGEGRARAREPGGAGDGGRHDRALVPVANRRPPLAAADPAPRPGRPAPGAGDGRGRGDRPGDHRAVRARRGHRGDPLGVRGPRLGGQFGGRSRAAGQAARGTARRAERPVAPLGPPVVLGTAPRPGRPAEQEPAARVAVVQPRRLLAPSRPRLSARRHPPQGPLARLPPGRQASEETSRPGPSGGSSGGRVAAGLSRQHHDEIYRRIAPFLVPAKGSSPSKKAGRPKPEPHELAEMWRCAASLERLAPEAKEGLGTPLARELSRPAIGGHVLWCLGRLGARVPLYGLANTVVRKEAVERWIDALLGRQYAPGRETADAIFALSQLARYSGDRARDLPDPVREQVLARLEQLGADESILRPVREYHELEAEQEGQALGDALPIGLRLREAESGGDARTRSLNPSGRLEVNDLHQERGIDRVLGGGPGEPSPGGRRRRHRGVASASPRHAMRMSVRRSLTLERAEAFSRRRHCRNSAGISRQLARRGWSRCPPIIHPKRLDAQSELGLRCRGFRQIDHRRSRHAMPAAADRHLLFGLLALQNGLIDQGQLVAAFQAWTRDKAKSLADHLEARGDLTGAEAGRPRGARRGPRRRRTAATWRRAWPPSPPTDPPAPAWPSWASRRSRRRSPGSHGTRTATPPRPTMTTTPTAPPACRSARPPATASGSACSGLTRGAGWARCSWPSMPSCTARWR